MDALPYASGSSWDRLPHRLGDADCCERTSPYHANCVGRPDTSLPFGEHRHDQSQGWLGHFGPRHSANDRRRPDLEIQDEPVLRQHRRCGSGALVLTLQWTMLDDHPVRDLEHKPAGTASCFASNFIAVDIEERNGPRHGDGSDRFSDRHERQAREDRGWRSEVEADHRGNDMLCSPPRGSPTQGCLGHKPCNGPAPTRSDIRPSPPALAPARAAVRSRPDRSGQRGSGWRRARDPARPRDRRSRQTTQ